MGEAAISDEISKPSGQKSIKPNNVFSISSGLPFLKELVSALMEGRLIDGFCPAENPFSLADVTIYVPSRRASRALGATFSEWFKGGSLILPKLRTLGDTDDDDFGLSVLDDTFDADVADLFLPPIGELDRLTELAQLVQVWRDVFAKEVETLLEEKDFAIPSSRADSIKLARELANLLAQFTQEEIDWKSIHTLIPDDHAEWWRLTSTFLAIVMETWPKHVAELGILDPTDRAVKLLKFRAERYSREGSAAPVIVAGSTGSVPSTRMLLKSVATLPNGAVVLPGVDFSMSDIEWKRLSKSAAVDDPLIESHPQFGLARTIGNLGLDRRDVVSLGTVCDPHRLRSDIVGVALSLSDFSADWKQQMHNVDRNTLVSAFQDVTLIEADNERQEALAIAISLREVLLESGKTAALVTPDRNLAKRVSSELKRFGLSIDDSGGEALAQSPVGNFVRKLVDTCLGQPSNADLTNFLKDPLAVAGFPSQASSWFEQVCLRGALGKPKPGALLQFVTARRIEWNNSERNPTLLECEGEEVWDLLLEWSKNLDRILNRLMLLGRNESDLFLGEFLEGIQDALSELAIGADGERLLEEARGAADLESLMEEAIRGTAAAFTFSPREAAAMLDVVLADRVVRTGGKTHTRLHIYGPLEVRLLEYDRVILAGLNEDSWPRNHRNDPFINRSMRRQLGLPSPERRTGLAAHDFQQLMGKQDVILSRSGRVDRSPAVASRWLQRLLALIGDTVSENMSKRGARYVEYAKALDASTDRLPRPERPNPKPPLKARPTSLAVTDIETWIRDPYALYAKKILNLKPLAPLDREPDALLKGTLFHSVMEKYVLEGGHFLPAEDRFELLKELLKDFLKPYDLDPELVTSWTERFGKIAQAYVQWELGYQTLHCDYETFVEVSGSTKIDDHFTLRARADRLDLLDDGQVNVFDYKTGLSPTPDQARTLSPQLSLEAFIALRDGFTGVSTRAVSDIRYLRLRTDMPFGKETITSKEMSIETIIDQAANNLAELVSAYRRPDQGYVSRYAPFKDTEMGGDYDHLARTREWSFGGSDGDA